MLQQQAAQVVQGGATHQHVGVLQAAAERRLVQAGWEAAAQQSLGAAATWRRRVPTTAGRKLEPGLCSSRQQLQQAGGHGGMCKPAPDG